MIVVPKIDTSSVTKTSTKKAANVENEKSAAQVFEEKKEVLKSVDCTDGKDDGKIGFWDGVGSFFKGIGNTIVNTVKDIVTDPKKLLLAAVTVGACFIPVVGPVIATGLAVAGGIGGAITLGKGIVKAVDCANSEGHTDAEARAAFEDIGSGTFTLVTSAIAVKGSLKSFKTAPGGTAKTFNGKASELAKIADKADDAKGIIKATATDLKNGVAELGNNIKSTAQSSAGTTEIAIAGGKKITLQAEPSKLDYAKAFVQETKPRFNPANTPSAKAARGETATPTAAKVEAPDFSKIKGIDEATIAQYKNLSQSQLKSLLEQIAPNGKPMAGQKGLFTELSKMVKVETPKVGFGTRAKSFGSNLGSATLNTTKNLAITSPFLFANDDSSQEYLDSIQTQSMLNYYKKYYPEYYNQIMAQQST